MYKVTALSVLLAAMGVGSAFANPLDIDFNSMDLVVNMGTNELYGLQFDINLADFNTEYKCENLIKGKTMDKIAECTQTFGKPGSRLFFEIENPLPQVKGDFPISKLPIIGQHAVEVTGNLIMSFTHLMSGQEQPSKFNVQMPVKSLKASRKEGNTRIFSAKEVLKVGEHGQLISGGTDGSNIAEEGTGDFSFGGGPSDTAPAAVGGGSTIRFGSEPASREDSLFGGAGEADEAVSFDDDFFGDNEDFFGGGDETFPSDDRANLREFLEAKEEASI